jgi:hypothetical protein
MDGTQILNARIVPGVTFIAPSKCPLYKEVGGPIPAEYHHES